MILDMFKEEKINIEPLISDRFGIAKAAKAYAKLADEKKPSLGIIIQYGEESQQIEAVQKIKEKKVVCTKQPSCLSPVIGVIGAGNYATQFILPLLKKQKIYLKTIVTQEGISGENAARIAARH